MTTQPTRNTSNAAYLLALAIVNRLDPRPQEDRAVKVRGRWYLTLDEAIRALMADSATGKAL